MMMAGVDWIGPTTLHGGRISVDRVRRVISVNQPTVAAAAAMQ